MFLIFCIKKYYFQIKKKTHLKASGTGTLHMCIQGYLRQYLFLCFKNIFEIFF